MAERRLLGSREAEGQAPLAVGEKEMGSYEGWGPGRDGPGPGQTWALAQLLVTSDVEPRASVSSLPMRLVAPHPPAPTPRPGCVRIKQGSDCWAVVRVSPTGLPTLPACPHPGSQFAAPTASACG